MANTKATNQDDTNMNSRNDVAATHGTSGQSTHELDMRGSAPAGSNLKGLSRAVSGSVAVDTRSNSESKACPECGSTHLSFDTVRGELFCDSCGFVMEEKLLDERPEWSAYDKEDETRLSRVGPPIKKGTLNNQLSTVVGTGTVDSKGTPIPQKSMRLYYHLGRLQRQVATSGKGERSVGAVSRALSRLASQLQLPPVVIEEASYICMRAIKSDLLRGRSIQALVSAAIYMACRNTNVPRTINEVVAVAGIGRKRLTKTVNILSRHLGIRAKPVDATDYVARFCSELALGEDVRALAGNILSKAPEENSLSPPGTAASAIYLAALARGQRVPQKRVAQVAGVSEVTLRSHFKMFESLISVTVPRGRVSPHQGMNGRDGSRPRPAS